MEEERAKEAQIEANRHEEELKKRLSEMEALSKITSAERERVEPEVGGRKGKV